MDILQLQGTPGSASSLRDIRPATYDDIEWMIDVAHKRYKDKWPFEYHKALLFLLQVLQSPQWLVLRGKRSCGAVFWDNYAFGHEIRRGHIYMLVSEKGNDLEPYHLVKAMALWASQQNCFTLDVHEETEYSLSPFMKRLGAKEGKSFTIHLERMH